MKKSVNPHLLFASVTPLFLILLLLSPSSSFDLQQQQQLLHQPSPPSRRLLPMEEKTRLGSTPPSCYNKCNGCHPCMAVQVPTIPISHQTQTLRRSSGTAAMEFMEPTPEGRYSNYKPLGWKCRCRNHLFNP